MLAAAGATVLDRRARAEGGGGATVERPDPLPVLRLADGGLAVLAGIVLAAAPPELAVRARETLAARLGRASATPVLLPAPPDRHGRGRVMVADVAEGLLGDGLALAMPEAAVDDAGWAGLLAAEARARAARRGVWGWGDAHGPFDAGAPIPAAWGRLVLVEGRIARIARTSIYWYANFGRSIRHDFTFRVPIDAEAAFADAGIDLAGLGERGVRVRGWLFEDNGPMIEITEPRALEILP